MRPSTAQVFSIADGYSTFLISLRIDEIDLNADSSAPVLPDMLLERNAALTAQPDAIPKLLEKLQSRCLFFVFVFRGA